MPVSLTANEINAYHDTLIFKLTYPFEVNFNAFDNKFLITWPIRIRSVSGIPALLPALQNEDRRFYL